MLDSAVADTTGLLATSPHEAPVPVPLEGVKVEARLRDFCSRVTLTQRFRNQEKRPLEVVYVFPLEEGAAVCAFEALVGDRRVVAEVDEREAAFAKYDDAIAAGHGAYLLDEERPDVFTASLGNLPPGAELLLKVSYVAELTREGDDVRFTLPTTISPRYAPASDREGVGPTSEPARPRAWLESSESGHGAVLLAFEPPLPDATVDSEVIFVVDRSGSMDGSSIVEARNALQLCLRSLRPGTQLNIVGFGSRFESLFEATRPYDDQSLREASRHVKRMDADLGGTEILAPLRSVLEQAPQGDRPRVVFLLTDGQVTNTDDVIALVRRHSDTTRVFTFGIGAGASDQLVKGVARAGRGAAESIAPGERIEGKVLRQLKRAPRPPGHPAERRRLVGADGRPGGGPRPFARRAGRNPRDHLR